MNNTVLDPIENTEISNRPYIAGFWRRLIAFFADILLIGFLCYIMANLFGSWMYKFPIVMSLIGYLLVITYFGIFNSKINQGQSFGKMLMSIQVVNHNQQYMSLPTSFLRAAILYAPFCLMSWVVSPYPLLTLISSIVLGSLLCAQIYLFIFNKANRRCVHDFIGHTYVINENTTNSDIKPTWTLHFYITTILACITSGICIYDNVTDDKSYIPNALKTFNFKDDHQFDFGYIEYPLENGQNFTENYFHVTTKAPERLSNPFYAEELAQYFYTKVPRLFTTNQQNYIIITARYQFGVVSLKQSSSYLIQQENNRFSASEQNHHKGFMIGGGF